VSRPYLVTAAPAAARMTPTAPAIAVVVPPGGGDAAATSTRDVAHHPGRVAPAPIRHLARTTVLALAIFGIHAAAAHPLTALIVGVGLFVAACALASRR
jgi:hypothetical protein